MLGEYKITAVRYGENEDVQQGGTSGIVAYQLNNGEKVVDQQEAIKMALAGRIANVEVRQRNDNFYLRSLPDGDKSNNLNDLPLF